MPLNPLPFIAGTNAVEARTNFESSLNFHLPPDWLNGTVDLRFEAPGVRCAENAGTPNDCAVTVTFQPPVDLAVRFLDVQWSDPTTGTVHANSDHSFVVEALKLISMYPLQTNWANWELSFTLWPGGNPLDPNGNGLFKKTLLRAIDTSRTPFDSGRTHVGWIYYGMVPDSNLGGQASSIGGQVACGSAPPAAAPFGYTSSTCAHEISHCLTNAHAVNRTMGTNANNELVGWCG
jgi:hypothetical protein